MCMKRFVRVISIIVAIFLMTVFIRNLLIIPICNFVFTQFLSNYDIKASNLLTLLFDLISLVVTTIIMPILWKILEYYQKKKENYSCISIYSKKGKNLSGVKKEPIRCKNLCIDLRKQSQENGYRIIYATIENTGKRDVVELFVNEQRVPVALKCQQSKDLVLFIDKFNDKRTSNPFTIDMYIEYQDNLSCFYSIKYAISVDLNKFCVSFTMKQKAKKIRR